jgi:hypothetical protein
MRRTLALLLAASMSAGCYSTDVVTLRSDFADRAREAANESRPLDASFSLRDGTRADFVGPRLDGDLVRGQVSACAGDGARCADILSARAVPFDDVAEIRIRRFSSGKTTALVLGIIGAAVIAGAAIVVATTSKSSPPPPPPMMTGSAGAGGSCPTAYSWDGHTWRLDSGTFGGSHFPASQRTDYDLLEYLAPVDGQYRIRLVNELPESEYTDAVAIQVVDHPAGAPVVPDLSGKLLTFRDAKAPLSATDLRGKDALASVAERDGKEWHSDLSDRRPDRAEDTRDGLLVQFSKPPGAKRAKLWIAARNTPWSVRMFKTMISEQGPDLAAWYAAMNASADARRRLYEFMAQEGMLSVEVQVGDSWTRRGLFWFAGPEILKDQAIEIPVADVPGDRVTIRLSAPVAFWSIDSLAVAFDDDEPVQARTLALRSALAEGGRERKELTSVLASADGERYATRPGDRAELSFDAPLPPAPGFERSYVLVTTGYYVPDVTPDPRADPKEVARIMATPGAAARMSLELLNVTVARELLR